MLKPLGRPAALWLWVCFLVGRVTHHNFCSSFSQAAQFPTAQGLGNAYIGGIFRIENIQNRKCPVLVSIPGTNQFEDVSTEIIHYEINFYLSG